MRSGLDDTMRIAYQSMREVWHGRDDVHGPAHRRLSGGDRPGGEKLQGQGAVKTHQTNVSPVLKPEESGLDFRVSPCPQPRRGRA